MDDSSGLNAGSEPASTVAPPDTPPEESGPEQSGPEEPRNSTAKALQTVAKEAWRLERVCDRLLAKLPFSEQKRYDGRLRWFRKQLDSALEDAGMRLVNIEGQHFEVGTAATALNIEDFREGDPLVVDKMVEPILMGPNGILETGTVTVKRAEP